MANMDNCSSVADSFGTCCAGNIALDITLGLHRCDSVARVSYASHSGLRNLCLSASIDARRQRALLEQLLALIDSRNAEDIALTIINEFGSVFELWRATPSRITNTLRDYPTAVSFLFALGTLANMCISQSAYSSKIKPEGKEIINYLIYRLSAEPVEVIYVLYFDAFGALLYDGIIARGDFTNCSLAPKEIARHALDLGAASLVLAHNHTSGDPTPSLADIELTRKVVDVCKLVDAKLIDHFIIGSPRISSFRHLGLL